ncbi:uncharacterized protein A4U43_UnF12080 [Asparagus officinalis]|uniref:AAA+ ATPase domain-containing protein n=1 Tax=Asparagus officinalis TaxID=4686 RepID=A0A1R3L547_ASPOF|nr:cell cycle checkpoint protein RAD17 isoform X2 [Asparagus officinalis]ONK54741.1 uncharacterized protein A4U43_UnF12080 [Asparagus officinalis]
MGKKRTLVVLSSSDEDEKGRRTGSSSRPRSAASSKSSRRGGSSRKLNVGRSRARSCSQLEEAVKFDKLSEDFGECLRDLHTVSGLKCTDMKEIWVEKYKPHSFAELAVHKKKVDEVKGWLEEKLMTSEVVGFGNSALLITGQAGVGKSAALQVISSQLGAELCEWTTPTPTLWGEHVHSRRSGRYYMSKLDEFEIFAEKVGKYCLLHPSCNGGSRKPVIFLIDDLPVTNGRIAFARLNKCLTTLVRSTWVPTVILITEYHKTESVESSSNFLEELQSSLEKAGAHKVVFNPLTVNSIKKTLFRICEEEKCDVTGNWIDHIARTSGGDIRHAITSLQYFCLRPTDGFSLATSTLPAIQSKTSVYKHNSVSSPSLAGTEDLDAPPFLPFGFGRDETINLFHALGKFLHNKRETDDSCALEQHSLVLQEKLSRSPLKMDAPEVVLSQAHGQARKVADFLHENVLDFISGEAIDDAWLVTSYLCDADLLLDNASHPTRFHMMSEIYESENLAQVVAASVATRGVLFGNSHPSPSRWHTIRSPRLWQIEQLSWHNKNQMASERFMDSNPCNLYHSSHVTMEYGSTMKWLRSKNFEVPHTCQKDISRNDNGVFDFDWMDQEKDETSEEIEEEEIEDW